MGELLPCPFCGGTTLHSVTSTSAVKAMECNTCGARGPSWEFSDHPTRAWSTRADLGQTVQRAWQVAEAARREAAELRARLNRWLAYVDKPNVRVVHRAEDVLRAIVEGRKPPQVTR